MKNSNDRKLLDAFKECVSYIDWVSREFGLNNDTRLETMRQLIRDVEAKCNPFQLKK